MAWATGLLMAQVTTLKGGYGSSHSLSDAMIHMTSHYHQQQQQVEARFDLLICYMRIHSFKLGTLFHYDFYQND